MKPTILIDFDRTIYDTNKFSTDFKTRLRSLGLNKDSLVKAWILAKTPFFSVKSLARNYDAVSRCRPSSYPLIKRGFLAVCSENQSNYWLPGARQFLMNSGKKFEVVILSFGDHYFQINKMKSMDLQSSVVEIEITKSADKLKSILKWKRKTNGKLFLIDDSIEACRSAHDLGVKNYKIGAAKSSKTEFVKIQKLINEFFESF